MKGLDINALELDDEGRLVLSESLLDELSTLADLTFAGGSDLNGSGCTNSGNCSGSINNSQCTNSGNCSGSRNYKCNNQIHEEVAL